MAKLIDKICKCRDILTKCPEKLRGYTGHGALFDSTVDDIHSQLRRKAQDYSRELDFTSQDLMEFAYDIQGVLKKWETAMCPKRNIKQLLKTMQDHKINLDPFTQEKTEIMALRRDTIEGLTRTLSVLEFHSVYLYFLESASGDKWTVEHTKRFGDV